jgi:ElaB/YqjD/DUF883 family membrane-anchored ribosome-binding protein
MGAEAVLLYNNLLLDALRFAQTKSRGHLELLATDRAWRPWVGLRRRRQQQQQQQQQLPTTLKMAEQFLTARCDKLESEAQELREQVEECMDYIQQHMTDVTMACEFRGSQSPVQRSRRAPHCHCLRPCPPRCLTSLLCIINQSTNAVCFVVRTCGSNLPFTDRTPCTVFCRPCSRTATSTGCPGNAFAQPRALAMAVALL